MPDTITLLAVSGSPGVREAIQAWSANGLLRQSVWIEREDLAKNPPGVMSTEVTAIGRAAVSCELREALGSTAYRLIRVVSVRQVLDDETDTELNDLLAAFTLRLRERVSETTTLLRINVVVPPDGEVAAKRLIDPDCAVNVVVSPEDRPAENMIDQGLDDSEVFAGHTALACATIGALWSSTEDGPFDDSQEFGSGARGGVVVVRPFARVADCRPLPEQILPALLHDGVSALGQYRPHRRAYVVDDKKLIEEAAEAFVRVDGHALCYHPPEKPPLVKPRRRVRKTFRMLWSFWRKAIGNGVLQLGRTPLTRLEPEEEQWLLDASEDGERGRLSPDEAADLAAQAPDSLRENPMMPRTVPAEPNLWPPLRQLGFSLVDGGNFPSELEELEKLRPSVSHPSWVAAPPEETFVVGDAAARILESCDIIVAGIRPTDSFAAGNLLKQLRRAEMAVAERKGLHREVRAEQLLVLQQCKQDFDAWMERNHGKNSLIGRLVHHVDEEIEKALLALVGLKNEYESQNKRRVEKLKPLERIRDRLVLRMTVCMALMVAAIAGWTADLVVGLPSWLFVVVGAVTAGAVVTQFYVFQLAAKATALEDALALLEARRVQTMAAVKRWPGEVERLGALYNITLDWGEIIGWMLHKPFSYTYAEDGLGAMAPHRPEAFHWGRAGMDSSAATELATAVTHDVFTPGWIHDLYVKVYASAVPESVTAMAPDAYNDADRSPAMSRPTRRPDTSDDPDDEQPVPPAGPPHAREKLLREFRELRCGATAGKHLAEGIEQVLLTMQPEKLLTAVEVGKRPDAVPAVDFLTAALPKPVGGAPCPQLAMSIFSDHGRIANKGKVVRVHLWGVAHRLLDKHSGQVRLHRGGAAEGSVQYQLSIIRLDVSSGCDPEDLRLPT
ncbi:hypothetical protein [Lentzea sp. NPDC059081]|uniref:hypothetical protein n=1 Tax=Lentzea sp. NPDC059081 TaxID=3346719 RepID=UPI0036940ECA